MADAAFILITLAFFAALAAAARFADSASVSTSQPTGLGS